MKKRIYMLGIEGKRIEVQRMNSAAVKSIAGVLPGPNYVQLGEVHSLPDLLQLLQNDEDGLVEGDVGAPTLKNNDRDNAA